MLSRQRSSARLKLNQVGSVLFFSLVVLEQFEPGVGHHHQGHMPVPTMPMAHLIVGHAHLAFGFFE